MWFLTVIFVGFAASFYLGCWVMYTGIKKIVRRDHSTYAIVLILLALGLLALSPICFNAWYHRIT